MWTKGRTCILERVLVLMRPDATDRQIQAIIARIERIGAEAQVIRGSRRTVIGAMDRGRSPAELGLDSASGVDRLLRSTFHVPVPAIP